MTQTTGLDLLRAEIDGCVIDESDPDYDVARTVWAGVDHRPVAIVRCTGAADVAAAIAFGRQHGLELSVRGGGHNPWGVAIAEGGLVIDLTELRGVTVDPETRRARCGGGTLLADLDAATQEYGLAVPTGLISDIGVGGLTLGGGWGWLSHYAGLTADNLVSAELVTADGSVLHVSADEHPDLFWALRGGGGNFGVVTSFEFQLHEIGPLVHIGLFFWGMDQGAEALRLGQEVLASLPRSAGFQMVAGLTAPPAEFVPVEHHNAQGYMLVIAGFGSADEHAGLVDRVRATLPPLFEFVSPLPYVQLQRMFDGFAPAGIHAYEKNLYLDRLTDDVIDTVVEHLPGKTSTMSFARVFGLGGAISDVPDRDSAFSGDRSSRLMLGMVAIAADAEVHRADRAWASAAWDALQPHIRGPREFINFMVDQDDQRVRSSYGESKYEQLGRLKARYDPENLFHLNANIEPVPQPSSTKGDETRMSTTTEHDTQVTPEAIMKLGMAYWGSKVLLSAVELGVFSELAAAGPLEGDALRERLGLHPRSAVDFFDALVTLGMLERQAGRYANTQDTALFLDRNKPGTYMGGVLEMANTTLYHNWGLLTDALRTGDPQSEAKDGKGFFEVLYSDPVATEKFAQGMAGASNYLGQMVATKFPWKDYRSVIDIGCSGGTASIQIGLANEHITGGGFDLPPLGPIFERRVAEFGLSDRLSFTAGDFFSDPLPQADVLVMGQLLHGFDLGQRRLLLEKAYEALPDGGALIVYDSIIDDERRVNTYGLLMSLTMLLQTPGGFESTGADYRGWFKESGFRDAYVEHLTGPHSMVVGIK